MISNLWPGMAPFLVAHAKHFDERNGVNLEIQFVEELSQVTSALGSGRSDLAYSVGPGQALNLLQGGIPIKILMTGDVSIGGDQVLAGKEIKSMKELKGKTVGVEKASTGYPLLVDGLNSAGLSISEINPLELSASQAAVALQSGQVDAAYTYQPYVDQTLAKGFHSLYKAGDHPGIVSDLLVGPSDYVEGNTDAIVGTMKAWQEGLEFVKSDPEEAYAITSKAMNIPSEELKVLLDPTNVEFNELPEAAEYLHKQLPQILPTFVEIVNGAPEAPAQITVSEAEEAIEPGPVNTAAESVGGGK